MMFAEASADDPDLSSVAALSFIAIAGSMSLVVTGAFAALLPSFEVLQPMAGSLLKQRCSTPEDDAP